MSDKLFLCNRCIKDSKLKLYFKSQTLQKKRCSFCRIKNKKCLDITSDLNFYNFFTSLIRYHYTEDKYNRHWGGDDVDKLFLEENDILNYNNMKDYKNFIYVIEDLCCVLNDYYGKNLGKAELYYGHIDGIRGCYFESISETSSTYLKAIETKLLKENYFLYEDEVKNKLAKYKHNFENVLLKSTSFYRARVGYKKKKVVNNFWDYSVKYTPYKKDKIGAPETKLVKGGRLNRLGVSFLYLATNIETAINEVRPDPGHKVSIGKFKSVKDLRIVDFDKAFINMSDTEKSLNDFQLLNHIDQLFSRPITQDERHKYIITQFFSDIFRKLGFDGVMFTSSVGSGKNLLIFNPKNFIYVGSKENKVYDILKLRYFSKAF